MNKGLIILLAIVGIALISIFSFISWANGVYDTAINNQETTIEMWGNVESSYQRRADLIPNLVNTVKGYAEHEKETLTEVMEARAKATSINIDPAKLTPAAIKQFQSAQAGISGALGKLMMVSERYPDLKANQNFLELQAQLEGTENRINVARTKYNESIKKYNTQIRGKFRGMALGWFAEEDDNFEKREPFQLITKDAENAPTVEF
ncbi:MAG: LemA family protein [Flavobacteriales bacterium]|nr:LemA family protein [Flavobacteriales bacterium]